LNSFPEAYIHSFVFVKQKRIRIVEAVENVVVNQVAKPFNTVLMREKAKQQQGKPKDQDNRFL
jgi:hypothetical protein